MDVSIESVKEIIKYWKEQNEKEIANLKKEISDFETKMSDSGFINSLNLKSKIRRTQKVIESCGSDLIKLSELSKAFHQLEVFRGSDGYNIPKDLINKINDIASRLNDEELSKVKDDVEKIEIRENAVKQEEKLQVLNKNLETAFENAKDCFNDPHRVNVSMGISVLESEKREQIRNEYRKTEIKTDDSIDLIIDMKYEKLKKFINSKDFGSSSSMKKIKDNCGSIVYDMKEKEKLSILIKDIATAILLINKEAMNSGVDYSALLTNLTKLKKEKEKSLAKIEKRLSKYDLVLLYNHLGNIDTSKLLDEEDSKIGSRRISIHNSPAPVGIHNHKSEKAETHSVSEQKEVNLREDIQLNRELLLQREEQNRGTAEDKRLTILARRKLNEVHFTAAPEDAKYLIAIYKEYMRYLMSRKDKKQEKIYFTDFASMKYGYVLDGHRFVPEESLEKTGRSR